MIKENLEETWESTFMKMDEQIVVQSYSEILLRNEEEWTTNIYNYMNKSQKHNIEQMKPAIKNI